MGRRRSAALALLLAATGASGVLSAPAGAGSGEDAAHAFRRYRAALEKAFVRADPTAERFFAAEQLPGPEHRVDWHRAIDDLDGDGGREVLLERWRFTFDTVGFGFTGTYRARVLDGRDGDVVWTYGNEFHGGFPALALRVRLEGGAPGLLFPKIDNQSAESPTYRLRLDAVDRRGERAWTRDFTTTFNFTTGGMTATDVPTTLEKFDPDGDAPTDFLVALTDYVRAALPDRAVARSDVYVLDARDGSMRRLGTVGPDTYWFHSIQAGPDVDGDPGEDVVIAGEENSPESYLEARSGLDGTTIWRKETYLGWYPWAAAVPDMSSDGAADLIVGWDRPNSNERVFQIWDARSARPLWKAEGIFPYVLGDQDRDGRSDIGAFEFVRTSKKAGARFLAFSRGRLLYEATHVEKPPDCGGVCISFGFYLDAGDIDGDSLRDTYVLALMATDGKPKRIEYAVTGADGSILYRELNLTPVRGSLDEGRGGDLLGFARPAEDEVAVTAYDGITRRALWGRSYRMRGARNLGPYGAYDALAELDGDAAPELLATVAGKRNATLVALDGATGAILWQRPIRGDARVTTPGA